jgi:uncharacterized membrane protein YqjE
MRRFAFGVSNVARTIDQSLALESRKACWPECDTIAADEGTAMIGFSSDAARQDFVLSWGIGAIFLASIGLLYLDRLCLVPPIADGWAAALAVLIGTAFFAVSYCVGTIISSIGVWLEKYVSRCKWFKASPKDDRLYPIVCDALLRRFKGTGEPDERDIVRLTRAFVNEESKGFVRAEMMFGIAVFYRGIAVSLLVLLVLGGVRIFHHFGASWATIIFLATLLASGLCFWKHSDYMRQFYGNLFCQCLAIAARLSGQNAPRNGNEVLTS